LINFGILNNVADCIGYRGRLGDGARNKNSEGFVDNLIIIVFEKKVTLHDGE
jgi:hypothetical protein